MQSYKVNKKRDIILICYNELIPKFNKVSIYKVWISIFLISALILAFEPLAIAQSPDWLWVERAGGFAKDFGNASREASIATDSLGNVFVTGEFGAGPWSTAEFGDLTLTSSGEDSDIFVAKFDPQGNVVWAEKAGGAGSDKSSSISINKSGQVLVTGTFGNTAEFGDITLSGEASNHIFVAKYDAKGNIVWAEQASGSELLNVGGITVDESGNVLLTGGFRGTVEFGDIKLTNSGSTDLFVVKYDSQGNVIWAEQTGGSDFAAESGSITVDRSGNVLVTGLISGTAEFGDITLAAGGDDVFVAKYDPQGNAVWAERVVGPNLTFESGKVIATDGSGNVLLTGGFRETAEFGDIKFSGKGEDTDIFVAKYNPQGNVVWAKEAGGPGVDDAKGIATDGSGNVLLTGGFRETAEFGDIVLSSTLAGGRETSDVFVAKYDVQGNAVWAKRAGGSGFDDGKGIEVDRSGNILVTGEFAGIADFGDITLDSAGIGLLFVGKIGTRAQIRDCSNVGQLTITADQFSQVSQDVCEATGNVNIDGVLHFEGTVTIDKAQGTIKASGNLTVPDVPVLGNTTLFSASQYTLDADDLTLGSSQGLSAQFEIGSLSVSLNDMSLVLSDGSVDGVELDLDLTFGNVFAAGSLRAQGEDAPKWILWRGGVSAAAVESECFSKPVSSGLVTGTGGPVKPAGLGDNLSVQVSGVQITQSNGVTFTGGRVDLPDIQLGRSAFELTDAFIEYRATDDLFRGGGELRIPAFGPVDAIGVDVIEVKSGYLNTILVDLGFSDPGLQIWSGPPIFMQSIGGGLAELAPGEPPIKICADTSLTGGPKVQGFFLMQADVGMEIDTGGRIAARGDVFVIKKPEGHLSGAEAELGPDAGFHVSGRINILDILKANGSFTVNTDNQMQGNFDGVLQIPSSWPIIGVIGELAGITAFLDNDKIGVQVDLTWLSSNVVYSRPDLDCPFNPLDDFYIGCDWEAIFDESFEASGVSAQGSVRAQQARTVQVSEDTDQAIFRVGWSQNEASFHLIDPDGNKITENTAADQPDKFLFRKNLDVPEAFYAVQNPKPGSWEVKIPDVSDIGAYTIQVFGGNQAPKINVTEPANDTSDESVTIAWTDKDPDDNAEVSLYYDDDREGNDGQLIQKGIDEDDENDQLTWDTSDVPSGTYYVYAKIDDGQNLPSYSYSEGAVTVANPDAPNPPQNLQADATDQGIDLSWEANLDNTNIAGYRVYFTDKPNQPGFTYDVAVGNRTQFLLDSLPQSSDPLPKGRSYRIAVVAHTRDGTESNKSDSVTVDFFAETGNNPPQITSSPITEAKVGQAYQYAVDASDQDGDSLSYSLPQAPSGMSIGSNGTVEWIPGSDQAGNHDVTIRVSDGQDGEATQSITIIVTNIENFPPEVFLMKPDGGEKVSGDVTIKWEATDRDDADAQLTGKLFLSPPDSNQFNQIASGLSHDGTFTWDSTSVSDGSGYQLQLVVSDGTDEQTDISGKFTVDNGQQGRAAPPAPPGLSRRPNDLNGNGTFEDVNGDGEFDADDAILHARLQLGLENQGQDYVANACANASDRLPFDFNDDGTCDVDDAIKLARLALGLDTGAAGTDDSQASSGVISFLNRLFGLDDHAEAEHEQAPTLDQRRRVGQQRGTPLEIRLPSAPDGLAGYRLELASDGTIHGIKLTSTMSLGIELAEGAQGALLGGLDVQDQVRPGAADVRLARVWVEPGTELDATLTLFPDRGEAQLRPVRIQPPAKGLQVEQVQVQDKAHELRFRVSGPGVTGVAVRVFDLNGRVVFDSGDVAGREIHWNRRTANGRPIANGVYLYRVTVHGPDGMTRETAVQKILILR